MALKLIAVLLLSISVSGQTAIVLEDGRSALGDSSALYKVGIYRAGQQADYLAILTRFAGQITLYASDRSDVSAANYQWTSGAGDRVLLPVAYDSLFDEYYLWVQCEGYCRYSMLVTWSWEFLIWEGMPQTVYLQPNTPCTLRLPLPSVPTSDLTFSYDCGNCKAAIEIRSFEGARESRSPLASSPLMLPHSFALPQPLHNTTYWFEVSTDIETTITATVTFQESAVLLRAQKVLQDAVQDGYKLYKFQLDDPDATVRIILTVFSGDVELIARYEQRPTIAEWDFRSLYGSPNILIITKDDREDKKVSTGEYYLKVFPMTAAHYALSFLLDTNTTVTLLPGVPQTGLVHSGESDYYVLNLPPAEDWNVTIGVSVLRGKVTLLAAQCHASDQSCISEVTVSSSAFILESHIDGIDTLAIPHRGAACFNTSHCSYGIIVQSGRSGAAYSLWASYDIDTVHVLSSGQAIRLTQATNEYQRLFRFTVVKPDVSAVIFKTTQYSGAVWVCAMRNCSSLWNCDRQMISEVTGTDNSLVFERGVDGESLQGTFCLSTAAARGYAEFSLMALEHTPTVYEDSIAIRSGYPQRDTLFHRMDRYMQIYAFSLHYQDEAPQAIKLTLAAISGRFNVFLCNSSEAHNRTDNTFTFQWMLAGIVPNSLNNTLVVDPSDESYEPVGEYRVLVIANGWGSNHSATYALSYKSGDGIDMLQEGLSSSEELRPGEISYYKFALHSSGENVKLHLTVMAGEVDIFLSFDRLNPRPSYKANHWGYYSCRESQSHVLEWNGFIDQYCTELPCSVYISLLSKRETRLSLTYTTESAVPELLQMGQPLTGSSTKDEFVYYFLQFPAADRVELVLRSIAGDADLYAYKTYGDNDSDPLQWQRPSRYDYTDSSQSGAAFDRVVFDPPKNRELLCKVVVGVYCRSQSCRYSIYAALEMVMLPEGASRYSHLEANQTKYFQFLCSAEKTSLVLRVTPWGSASLRLYVSRGSHYLPNATHHDWYYAPALGKQLEIHSSDPKYAGGSMKGDYLAAVAADDGVAAAFAITYLTASTTVLSLHPGVPQPSQSFSNETVFFTYHHSYHSALVFSLILYLGAAEMYISPSAFPSSADYAWSTQSSDKPGSIYVSTGDPNFCSDCDYWIAVRGSMQEQLFMVSAGNVEGVALLMNGVPVRGDVDKGEVRRFALQVIPGLGVDVAVVSYAGDADLYVGSSADVSPDLYEWKSISTDKVDHVRVSAQQLEAYQSLVYFCVYGASNAGFSITAHMKDSYIHLIDGWPMQYSLDRSVVDSLFFDFHASGTSTHHTQCSLRPLITRFYPQVYITFQPANTQAVKPAPGVGSWSYDSQSHYENAIGELTIVLPEMVVSGKFNIGVYSKGERTKDLGVFSLMCTTNSQAITLRNGQSGYGLLSQQMQYMRYSFLVSSPGLLQVAVTPCSGKVLLDISSNRTFSSSPGTAVVTLADGRLFATVLNAQGGYYLTVKLLAESEYFAGASFQIMAIVTANRSATELQAGGDGIVTWKQISAHRLRFHWNPPEALDGEPLKTPMQVRYRLFYTYSTTFPMRTACGINAGELNGVVLQPRNHPLTGQVTFVLFVDELRPVQVTLIAYIDIDAREVSVPYQSVYIDLAPRPWRIGWVYIVLAGALLLLAASALVVVLRRYKEAKRKLTAEVPAQRHSFEKESEMVSRSQFSELAEDSKDSN